MTDHWVLRPKRVPVEESRRLVEPYNFAPIREVRLKSLDKLFMSDPQGIENTFGVLHLTVQMGCNMYCLLFSNMIEPGSDAVTA